MPQNKKEDTKTTIVESAAKGGMTAAMPYAAIAGVGVIGYLLLKDNIKEGFSNVTTNASRVIENISETITNTINNTTENISNFIDENTLDDEERKDIELEAAASSVGSAPGVKLPNLSTEQQNFISKYSDDKKKTTNFKESPFLDMGLGPSTSPLERSMLGLGLVSGDTTKTQNNNKAKMATFKYGSESPLAQSKKDKSTSNEIGQVSNNANTNTSKATVTRDKNTGRYSVSVPKGKKIKVVRRFS
jgi:hypothetical protein